MEGALKALMQDDARLADLKAIAEGVASAVLKATTDKDLGIGYWVDVEMGTNSALWALPGAPHSAHTFYSPPLSPSTHYYAQRPSSPSLGPRPASAVTATLLSFCDRRFSTTPTIL